MKKHPANQQMYQKSSDDDQLAKIINVKEQYLARLKDLLKFRHLVEDMLKEEKILGNSDNQILLDKHIKYIEKQVKKVCRKRMLNSRVHEKST